MVYRGNAILRSTIWTCEPSAANNDWGGIPSTDNSNLCALSMSHRSFYRQIFPYQLFSVVQFSNFRSIAEVACINVVHCSLIICLVRSNYSLVLWEYYSTIIVRFINIHCSLVTTITDTDRCSRLLGIRRFKLIEVRLFSYLPLSIVNRTIGPDKSTI